MQRSPYALVLALDLRGGWNREIWTDAVFIP